MQQTAQHKATLGPRLAPGEWFRMQHPEEAAWIEAKKDSFAFAADMANDVLKWGNLTHNQLAAVRRCMQADKLRTEAKPVPTASLAKIEQAFAAAKAAGIQRPRLLLDSFQFKPAGKGTANEGAIYVTDGGTYLGKIANGKFCRVRECTEDQEARIVAAASAPLEAAVAYGMRTGRCAVCNTSLKTTDSVDLGIGPVCRKRMGWFTA